MLGRLRLLFLLGRLWFRLLLWRFWLRLLLLALGLRRSLLVLGRRLLGLLTGLLLLSASWSTAGLKLYDVLSDGDGVLLVDEELLNSTSLGRIDGDVDFVGLDSRDFFILLNVVANLCILLATGITNWTW